MGCFGTANMCKIKYFLVVLVSSVLVGNVTGMSEKQLTAAVRMVRNVCQPKTKASNEDIDKMHKGDWNIDHSAMCYTYCCLNMYKLMDKDNKFNYESGLVQLKQVPDRFKGASGRCMEECRNAAVTLNDKCIAAYEIAKCLYFCSPDNYYLP